MKINEEDIIEFIEDKIITLSNGEKIVRFLPFEWDEFLKEQRRKR